MTDNQQTEESKDRIKLINKEIRLVFDTFGIGEFERPEGELRYLRMNADDIAEVESSVVKSIVAETSIKEEDTEFEDVVKLAIYSYYLMLHFTDMYLKSGDFPGLTGHDFKDVWERIPVWDKSTVVEMAIILEDTLTIVHGMYLLLAQVERGMEGLTDGETKHKEGK